MVRAGRAPHPDGTEVHPDAWWEALTAATEAAGGLADVDALAVGGQQHGMVCLDAEGQVVRPALLWNDTRSAAAAGELVAELGGGRAWAEAVGVVPVASITVAKLRWFAEHEPDVAARAEVVCLPHDWLTWRLSGAEDLTSLRTDRSDASGTGYWSAAAEDYRLDLLEMAFGRALVVPGVLGPTGGAGRTADDATIGPGAGDNAAAALGVGADVGDIVVSIGTSGVVSAVAETPACDPGGIVAGFADATGRYLPLVCTLNASRVLDAAAALLRVDHNALSHLALEAPAGAGGLVLVPYLDGERTPDRPDATGSLHGMTIGTTTPAHLARAAVEGLLCGLADGLDALVEQGALVQRVLLVGGGARSDAVRRIAPAVLGVPVHVPPAGEYVADGAARQAAWVLSGGETPPEWAVEGVQVYEADPAPHVRERYAEVREMTAQRRTESD